MARGVLAALALAFVLRAAVFTVADNKHGDAPMRALIAERMVLDPASAGDPRTYCQFGPLHTTLMRPFIAVDPLAPRSSRVLSLLAGLAVFFPFAAFARRVAGEGAAALACFALAVSPLHIQASTTAASEALYLLLWVAALERLLAALAEGVGGGARTGTFALAGLLASLAAVTRYDAWLALPVMVIGALVVGKGPSEGPLDPPRSSATGQSPAALPRSPGPLRARLRGLAVFSLCAAVLPAAWLAWGARAGGDPLFFAHYIMTDHADVAGDVAGRFGPVLGRARQLGIWLVAFLAAMTLPGAALAVAAIARGWRRLAAPARIVVVAALAPPALYLARGLLLQQFEPLARFALVPGTLLLPLAAAVVPAARGRAFRAATATAAVVFSLVVWLVATAGRERIWAGAESMGALTRLDGEDRALAAAIRARRAPHAPVMIEPLAFADIAIAHAAGVPWTESVSLTVTRTPRATATETMATTGARLVAGYDRPGGWPRTLPDWPPTTPMFGRWRLLER
jgi:hypothetical protein